MMHKFFFFSLLTFWVRLLHPQQNYPDSVAGTFYEAVDFIKNTYYLHRGNEAAIYNGKLHYPYSSEIEGIAYFNSANWQMGDVIYEGTRYKNILMKYDLVMDQLVVVQSQLSGLPICLNSSRVKQFSFLNYKFIRLDYEWSGSELPVGFYRQLNTGTVNAFARTEKTITEKITDNKVVRKFEEKTRYYIFKGDVFTHIRNKNDLYRVLNEHPKEIRGFIKENRLNYRKTPEKTIASVVDFYNLL